jgi:putative endonuclease
MPIRKTIGNYGESLASDFLKSRGYIVVARNMKISYGEIDIVTAIDNVFVFVEVKTKLGINTPAENGLSRRQITKVKQTIAAYCRKNKLNLERTRFDFISINIDKPSKKIKLKHYKNIY